MYTKVNLFKINKLEEIQKHYIYIYIYIYNSILLQQQEHMPLILQHRIDGLEIGNKGMLQLLTTSTSLRWLRKVVKLGILLA